MARDVNGLNIHFCNRPKMDGKSLTHYKVFQRLSYFIELLYHQELADVQRSVASQWHDRIARSLRYKDNPTNRH
ncbi:MAG: hypothetical protein AAGF85_01905 [Bacteroidota bacterium]